MYFDRFDICAAYYWFANDFHSGQNSVFYKWFARLNKLRYRPALLEMSIDSCSENAQEIYNNLIIKHGVSS